ncbi:MAG: site-specific DNA recombinase [Crocinitomix sp.]|jgi:site-specific DNA recombinase
MKEFDKMKAFARTARKKEVNLKNCVIYTRVSSSRQSDEHGSLDTQLRMCKEYAIKAKYNVIKYFGGTYESAKSEERGEFQKMMKFIESSETPINYILVYKLSRFSRSGANAIYLSEQLRNKNINIISATEYSDTSTSSGVLLQNMQFVYNKYENDMRTDMIKDAVVKKIRQGYTMFKSPRGYDQKKVDGEPIVTINKDGDYIRKAFYLKANKGLNYIEISQYLRQKYDFEIKRGELKRIFKNPYYTGIIVSKYLEGEIIKGRHEAIVPYDVFLKVNELNKRIVQGYECRKKNDNCPLTTFVICNKCSKNLVGYDKVKKKKSYYKCPTIGCKCNINNEKIHDQFGNLLDEYSLDDKFKEPLHQQLKFSFNHLNKENQKEKKEIEQEIDGINKKLDKIKVRYSTGEIDQILYDEVAEIFNRQLTYKLEALQAVDFNVSSFTEYLEDTIDLGMNLKQKWINSDYDTKRRIQRLVFPDGVTYNRLKHEVAPVGVNSLFKLFNELSNSSGGTMQASSVRKTGDLDESTDLCRTFISNNQKNKNAYMSGDTDGNASQINCDLTEKKHLVLKPFKLSNNFLLDISKAVEVIKQMNDNFNSRISSINNK